MVDQSEREIIKDQCPTTVMSELSKTNVYLSLCQNYQRPVAICHNAKVIRDKWLLIIMPQLPLTNNYLLILLTSNTNNNNTIISALSETESFLSCPHASTIRDQWLSILRTSLWDQQLSVMLFTVERPGIFCHNVTTVRESRSFCQNVTTVSNHQLQAKMLPLRGQQLSAVVLPLWETKFYAIMYHCETNGFLP